MSSDRDPNRTAKHSHYVSNANGAIYPAQTGLPGVEDENPVDWRPATYDEIEAFKRGEDNVRPRAKGEINLDTQAPLRSPSTLTLADDDDVVPSTPTPVAPVVQASVVSQDPPPPPPAALAGVPTPAFSIPQ